MLIPVLTSVFCARRFLWQFITKGG